MADREVEAVEQLFYRGALRRRRTLFDMAEGEIPRAILRGLVREVTPSPSAEPRPESAPIHVPPPEESIGDAGDVPDLEPVEAPPRDSGTAEDSEAAEGSEDVQEGDEEPESDG